MKRFNLHVVLITTLVIVCTASVIALNPEQLADYMDATILDDQDLWESLLAQDDLSEEDRVMIMYTRENNSKNKRHLDDLVAIILARERAGHKHFNFTYYDTETSSWEIVSSITAYIKAGCWLIALGEDLAAVDAFWYTVLCYDEHLARYGEKLYVSAGNDSIENIEKIASRYMSRREYLRMIE